MFVSKISGYGSGLGFGSVVEVKGKQTWLGVRIPISKEFKGK